ncbi:MAG: DUF554 domain-containing protein [Bacilli bacterium]
MLVTLLNCCLIIIGSIAGLTFRKVIGDKYKKVVMEAIGLCILGLGIYQAVGAMSEDNANPLLFIVAIVFGRLLGELINLDEKINRIGMLLKSKFANDDKKFSEGFVTASILYCVGTLTILGAVKSGTEGDDSILLVKSVLDGITSVFLAASFGIGVVFSIVPVLIIQGGIVIFSSFVSHYITPDMLRELSVIGGLILVAIGLVILEIRKLKISNYIPALIVPVIYYLIF